MAKKKSRKASVKEFPRPPRIRVLNAINGQFSVIIDGVARTVHEENCYQSPVEANAVARAAKAEREKLLKISDDTSTREPPWSDYWSPADWKIVWRCKETVWRKLRDEAGGKQHPTSKHRLIRFRRAELNRLGLCEPKKA